MASYEQYLPDRSAPQEAQPPLPRERSLQAFFEDLGVTNLIVGTPGVGHEREWRVIPNDSPEELDRLVRERAFGRGRAFLRRTKEPLSTRRIEHSGSLVPSSFGETEEPSFTARDGTKFTFISAGFDGSDFILDLRIERPGENPLVADYTVPGLRFSRMKDEIREVEKQNEMELMAQINLLRSDSATAGGIVW